MKKYILGLILAALVPVSFAYASTPMLTVTGAGDNNNVTVRVTGGEINAPVVLFYNENVGGQGNVKQAPIGTTDINGNFTGTISTSGLGISMSSPVYVQVGGYQSLPVNWPYNSSGTGTSNSGSVILFSPASPTFTVGQNGTVTLSGIDGGTYYVASNSNPNFTNASISGNTLTVNGSQMGQSSVTVCSTSGPCAVITPTFSMTGSTASSSSSTSTTGPIGSPTLSASSVNVGTNGQGSLTLSGGTTPYTVSVLSGNNVSTTLLGNTLYINGGSATGTAMLNICSGSTTGSGPACTPVTVNVQSQAGSSGSTGSNTGSTTGTTTSSPLSFSLPISSGEALRLSLAGGTGSYFIQPASGSSPVSATLNGNLLTVVGSSTGSGMVNVCSGTTSTTCLPIAFTVGPALTGTGGGYFFETDLSEGMSGEDVTELQQRLHDLGYFNTAVTGYFGPLTASAVKAYQAANGISSTGYVGPMTRSAFNK